MISRHHYPDPLDKYGDAEHDRALARLAADLGGVPLAPRGDRTFPPPAPGVCDCDEPLVRDSRGNAVDIGEPWPRGWLGKLIVNALFYAVWLAFGAAAGWAAIRLWGVL